MNSTDKKNVVKNKNENMPSDDSEDDDEVDDDDDDDRSAGDKEKGETKTDASTIMKKTASYLNYVYNSVLGECIKMGPIKINHIPYLLANCFVNICLYNYLPYNYKNVYIYLCNDYVYGGEIVMFRNEDMLNRPHMIISMVQLQKFFTQKPKANMSIVDDTNSRYAAHGSTLTGDNCTTVITSIYDNLILKVIAVCEHLFLHYLDLITNGYTDWHNHTNFKYLNYNTCVSDTFSIIILDTNNENKTDENNCGIKIKNDDDIFTNDISDNSLFGRLKLLPNIEADDEICFSDKILLI